jgi:von Willebrand factor type D domain
VVSLCIVSGEPHIKTFDKQKVNYQGICKQLLVEPSSSYTGPNTFEVYMRNEYRNGNQEVSFPKDLIINLCGDEVQLLGGQTSAPRVPVRAKV